MFLAEDALDKCISMLHDSPLMYVHVICPYKEVRRRHIERGNRGNGKVLELDIHDETLVAEPNGIYDLVVNTYAQTIEECVDKIIELSSCGWEFTAFKRLKALSD